MTGFYPYPESTPHLSRSQVWPSSQNSTVERLIYPRMYQTGYGRFRPNKSDYHLRRRYYRGGWHRPYPPLIPRPLKSQEKTGSYPSTWSSLVTIARIAKFSRLLHPVGSGFVSQNPSPGYVSQHPYA